MIPFLIVLLVLFAILSLKAQVIIEYREDVALTARVCGVPIRILPKKRRHKTSMSKKEAERLMKKRKRAEEKKRLKAEEKRKKKAEKKKKRLAEREKARSSPAERRKALAAKRKKKAESATFEENLDLVKRLVSFFFPTLAKHLRIDVTRIHIVIGTDEASKTAILYGVTVQAVAYILTLLDRVTNVKTKRNPDVYVDTDFLAEETKVDLKIGFSLRLWHVLHLAFGALFRFIGNRIGVKRRVALAEVNASQQKT